MPGEQELWLIWVPAVAIALLLLIASGRLFWLVFFRKSVPSFDDNLRTAFEAQFRPETFISLQEMAAIERDLVGLCMVVVIANELDDPHLSRYKSIYEAMKDNFMEGVKYTFLISPTQYKRRGSEFSTYFSAIYTVAKYEAPTDGPKSSIHASSFESLCRIVPLSREWTSFPYIFYRFTSDGQTTLNTIAYRGADPQEGLSNSYCEVASPDAVAILNALQMSLDRTTFEEVAPTPGEIVSPSKVLLHPMPSHPTIQ